MIRRSGTERFLSNAVQAFGINSGSINGLIDSILGNLTLRGSLYNYTSNRGFRDDNLINNFEASKNGRYGYADNQFSVDYNVWDKISASYPLETTSIGMPYEKYDEIGNSELLIKTKGELDSIEEEYRLSNLSYHWDKQSYLESLSNSTVTRGKSTGEEKGQEYIVTEGKIRREGGDVWKERNQFESGFDNNVTKNGLYKASDTFRDRNLSKLINGGKNGSYNYPKHGEGGAIYANLFPEQAITSPGKFIGDEYYVTDSSRADDFYLDEDGDIFDRNTVNRNKNIHRAIIRGGLFYKTYVGNVETLSLNEKYTLDDIINLGEITLPSEGLLGYTNRLVFRYGEYKGQGVRDLAEKMNPYGSLLWNGRMYGFKYDSNTYGIYSINNENVFTSPYTIDNSFNGGSLRTYNTDKNTNGYVTYKEADGKDNVPSTINVTSNSSDNVAFNEFNNASAMLKRTNALFSGNTIKSLVNRFHTDKVETSELVTAVSEYGMSRGRNLLKGSVDTETGYSDPYCRVWTKVKQFSKYKHAIRHTGPDTYNSQMGTAARPNTEWYTYSALGSNGIPHYAPNGEERSEKDIKRYMFSIENLAWRDMPKILSDEQQLEKGPNGGRIMWFPPYNLKFNENISTSWNDNTFIGRGEKIYTYTNTERKGTLSFTILVDHPSIINEWRGEGEPNDKIAAQEELLRFFAGCGELQPNGSKDTKTRKSGVDRTSDTPDITPKYDGQPIDIAYVVFFPNDFSAYDYENADSALEEMDKYENGSGAANVKKRDDKYSNEILAEWNLSDKANYGLNTTSTSFDTQIKNCLFGGRDIEELYKYVDFKQIGAEFKVENGRNTLFGIDMQQYEIKGVDIQGFASSHGRQTNNEELCRRRRAFMKKILLKKASNFLTEDKISEVDGKIIEVAQVDGKDMISSLDAKIARAAIAVFHLEMKEDLNLESENETDGNTEVTTEKTTSVTGEKLYEQDPDFVGPPTPTGLTNTTSLTITEDGVYTYDNEYLYFQKIKEENDVVYKNIVDKIKYFDPAFHSMTPEGFNARLTFLNQCTRQGPTKSINGGANQTRDAQTSALYEEGKISDDMVESYNTRNRYYGNGGNLAFGRAPYCVLRIGDFYHTKICIDSISIDYDTDGIHWDLNPEGIGIQPMMANVNISFTFVGGQSLDGPISRLQTAVSSNFYANAMVYDKNADTKTKTFNPFEGVTTE